MTVTPYVVIDGQRHNLNTADVVRVRTCDRCKAEIGHGEPYVPLSAGGPDASLLVDPSGRVVPGGGGATFDLCQGCGALFERFVGANGASS